MRRRASCLALVAPLLVGGCSARLGVPDPGTQEGSEVLRLWQILFWSAAGVGALVLGLIAWCVLRYRRRDRDELPPQVGGHIPLELFYTAVPLALAGFLFGANLVVDHRTRDDGKPAVEIDVTGFQWQWRFAYRDEGVTVLGDVRNPPELVLPVGSTVRLHLRTLDVIHSFFVPGFLVKRDLIPGVENTVELRPVKPGHYLGHCAEFCGLDHARMNFDVRVLPRDQFRDWVRTARAQTTTASRS